MMEKIRNSRPKINRGFHDEPASSSQTLVKNPDLFLVMLARSPSESGSPLGLFLLQLNFIWDILNAEFPFRFS